MEKYKWYILGLIVAGAITSALNQGIPILDARFHYSVEEARYFLSSLSPDNHRRHIWGEFADLFLFIPAYTALMLRLSRGSSMKLLGHLTVMAATADIIETSTILYCLLTAEIAPHYLPQATTLKWLSVICFVLLYAIEKKLFLRHLRRR